jgi:hypothetical protein
MGVDQPVGHYARPSVGELGIVLALGVGLKVPLDPSTIPFNLQQFTASLL